MSEKEDDEARRRTDAAELKREAEILNRQRAAVRALLTPETKQKVLAKITEILRPTCPMCGHDKRSLMAPDIVPST